MLKEITQENRESVVSAAEMLTSFSRKMSLGKASWMATNIDEFGNATLVLHVCSPRTDIEPSLQFGVENVAMAIDELEAVADKLKQESEPVPGSEESEEGEDIEQEEIDEDVSDSTEG